MGGKDIVKSSKNVLPLLAFLISYISLLSALFVFLSQSRQIVTRPPDLQTDGFSGFK